MLWPEDRATWLGAYTGLSLMYDNNGVFTVKNQVKLNMGNHLRQVAENSDLTSVAARRALVDRISSSATFRRSAKLREFLDYIASRAFADDFESISEHQIGIAVFRRSPGYNPGDDSIVRVQARHLREKLNEYFSGEGHAEPLVVRIPKGSYIPVFEPRAREPIPDREAPARDSLVQRRRTTGYRYALMVFFCVASFVLGFWLNTASQPKDAGSRQDAGDALPAKSMNPLLGSVLSEDSDTMIVAEDTALLVAYVFRDTDRFIGLDDYRHGRFLPNLDGKFTDEAYRRRLSAIISNAQYANFANAKFALDLVKSFPLFAGNIEIRHPRDIHVRDIRSSNCILLGGTTDNPWIGLFEDRMHFPMLYFGKQGRGFANRHPRANESRAYGNRPEDSQRYYARVAILPNIDSSYSVLILTGMGTPATEAAAEFVLDPDSVSDLPAALRAALLEAQPRQVEVLLECSRVLGAPYRTEVAAWRVGGGTQTTPE